MPIDKRDLALCFSLSLAFFLMATWNLGIDDVPISTWIASDGESFYIDLGSPKNVSVLYLLLKRGEIDLELHTGNPGSWSGRITASLNGYYSWEKIGIDRETRYIRLVFEPTFGEIAEIAVISEGVERIAVSQIIGGNGGDERLMRLIDEQEKVKLPPTYVSETYFDEIYFVRAAEDYLTLDEPFERSHPPLGKLMLAAGISAFGYSPFGWRIMGVLFATLMIPVIYLLGKRMFGSWLGAFSSAFLLTFDFMHFTMGRIATVDTFVVFFSLVSQFFFFTYFQDFLSCGQEASIRPLFLAVVFFSLGFSTKWYILFGFAGQIFLFLILRSGRLRESEDRPVFRRDAFSKNPSLTILGFITLSAIIYLLTFVPYLVIGHTLKDVYDRQWSMFHYHSVLSETHPFSSSWWSWPFILKPLWLYLSELPEGMVSTIAAMGNPAVWWIGLVSMGSAIEKVIREKDRICLFIITIFLFQWLPYALITRCTFIYHFYINVPLLCLATAYFINKSWNSRSGEITGLTYLIVIAALYVLFYPVISGSPIARSFIAYLRWFNSWKF
jgi:dolichyl-phosphate-mannose-protein mannosyltransferase